MKMKTRRRKEEEEKGLRPEKLGMLDKSRTLITEHSMMGTDDKPPKKPPRRRVPVHSNLDELASFAQTCGDEGNETDSPLLPVTHSAIRSRDL